jgi:hypothetical protein
MRRKVQGEDESKVWEQGFKVCNTPIETDRMKLSTFLWFLMFFLFFFSLFCYKRNVLYSIPSSVA